MHSSCEVLREKHLTSWKMRCLIRVMQCFRELCTALCRSLWFVFLAMTLLPCESPVPLFPQRAISESRSLPIAEVGTHLCQALAAGRTVSLERAGLTPAVQRVIRDVIHNPPILSGECHWPCLQLLIPARPPSVLEGRASARALLSFQGSVVK